LVGGNYHNVDFDFDFDYDYFWVDNYYFGDNFVVGYFGDNFGDNFVGGYDFGDYYCADNFVD